MRAIDRHAWTNRWYRHHPAERLLLAGGGLVLALSLPPLTGGPLLLLAMAGAAVLGAGVPARAFLMVLALPVGFLVTSAPFLALTLDWADGLRVGWSPAGAWLALAVSARALGAMASLALLVLTTPVTELLPWLRRLGVPAAVVEVALLTYRLIFVLFERALTGQQAQAARQGYSNHRRALHALGLLVANLLQRSLARARRLETGLAARNWRGELAVLTPPRVLSGRRLARAAALLAAVAVAALLLDRLLLALPAAAPA